MQQVLTNCYTFNGDIMSGYLANYDFSYDAYSVWLQQQTVTHHGMMTGNIALVGQWIMRIRT